MEQLRATPLSDYFANLGADLALCHLAARNVAQKPFWACWRIGDDQLHGFAAGIQRRVINVGGDVDACARADFNRCLIIDHLFAFATNEIDDFL